jgi:ECF sigma factor
MPRGSAFHSLNVTYMRTLCRCRPNTFTEEVLPATKFQASRLGRRGCRLSKFPFPRPLAYTSTPESGVSVSDVTQILSAIEQGDPFVADELLPVVYGELRRLAATKMAKESPDHSLQATALVHEAYLRLVDTSNPQAWKHRGHFFAAAAESMRRILVESARRRDTEKRGGASIMSHLTTWNVMPSAPLRS